MEYSERDLIDRCIRQIEHRFFPELEVRGGKLKQRDLEYLMELIEERSATRISLSTMKRIWRGDFNRLPHTNTLSALVSLLGHGSWKDFRQANQASPSRVETKGSSVVLWKILVAAGGILLIGFTYFTIQRPKPVQIPTEVHFSANKTVVNGVPNTVIFNYDLTQVEADSFFIQRSWNPSNKNRVDPKKRYFSETYYYPGFHWASLIANETVIKRTRINIQTDGWFATAKPERLTPIPVYLNQKDLYQNGQMRISDDNFSESGFDPKKGLVLSYFNIRAFGDLRSDAFILETKLKFDDVKGLVCPMAEVRVIDEADATWLTLTDKGCVGNLYLKVGTSILKGSENDFSKLGATLTEWQTIRLVSSGQRLKFYRNGQLILDTPFEGTEGRIMGIVLTFSGRGVVDYFRLKDLKGDLIYTEEFQSYE